MPDPKPKHTEWCHNGDTYEIDTFCEGMTEQECQAEHDALVAAAQLIFPPNC